MPRPYFSLDAPDSGSATAAGEIDWLARFAAARAERLRHREERRRAQAEFAEARRHGLAARHATKLARLRVTRATGGVRGPASCAGGDFAAPGLGREAGVEPAAVVGGSPGGAPAAAAWAASAEALIAEAVHDPAECPQSTVGMSEAESASAMRPATPELATSELATSELATSELATSELATSELATSELAVPELAVPESAVPGEAAAPESVAVGSAAAERVSSTASTTSGIDVVRVLRCRRGRFCPWALRHRACRSGHACVAGRANAGRVVTPARRDAGGRLVRGVARGRSPPAGPLRSSSSESRRHEVDRHEVDRRGFVGRGFVGRGFVGRRPRRAGAVRPRTVRSGGRPILAAGRSRRGCVRAWVCWCDGTAGGVGGAVV